MKGSAGVYVYGFVRSGDGPLPWLTGVAGGNVSLAEDGPVAAVVSELPDLMPQANRADLMAHSRVLQTIVAERDVVPVQFGSVYASVGQVQSDLLRSEAAALERLMADVAGRVELRVKAVYAEGPLLALLFESDRKLRHMKESMRTRRDDYRAKVELGRRIAGSLERRRAIDAKKLLRELAEPATDARVEDPPGEYGLLKASFLVARERLDDFDRALDRREHETGELVSYSVKGPLPPYSFVNGPLARAS